MTDEQQIRRLLNLADPARGVAIPPASATARQLIARTGPARTRLYERRLVLAGGLSVAVAAVTAYALGGSRIPAPAPTGHRSAR